MATCFLRGGINDPRDLFIAETLGGTGTPLVSQFSFSHFFYRQSQVEQPPRSLSSFRSVCMVGRAGLEPAVCLCNGFTVRPLRR